MKISTLLSLAGLAVASHNRAARDHANHDYYVLHLDRSAAPEQVATRLGLRHEGPLGSLDHHHVFRSPKSDHDVVKREIQDYRRRKRDVGGSDLLDGVLLARKQEPRMHLEKRAPPPPRHGPSRRQQPRGGQASAKQSEVMKALGISDPIFIDQWHLMNSKEIGHDVNVTGLWLEGITGKNATVAIVDDGLDMNSGDLAPNYFAEGSWDFNDHDPSPAPELSDDRHGTRCAGEVAAARNDVCGVGVAYDSKIAGLRILSKAITDADEAEAMMYHYQDTQIYSCSWGPSDDGRTMEAPGVLIRRAMLQAVQKGRGGLGSIYVFASGNGAANGDNCNFDGYTNSIYSITVGAVDHTGAHPYYSEHCSAQLVVTYSSGNGDAIHTTDVGANACYSNHGGTSAAAPLAAGIFALVMQVRPDLSWRDMQYLAMDTAVPIDDGEAEWQKTSIGKSFSHTFGYGKIDSYALVEKAKDWKNVKPQAWYFSPWVHIKKDIPQGTEGLTSTLEVTGDMLKEANVARVEHVTITMNVEHSRRGDLSVDLISPEGVVSHLAVVRKLDSDGSGYKDWTFMSVAHWGESGVGKWTLIVRDTEENEFTGKFVDWHLKLWGESIDAKKATLLPMPSEHDDDDHDVVVPISTAPASSPTEVVTKPSDHPERPTKNPSKPSATQAAAPSGTNVAQETTSAASSSWVSWLPDFGSKKVWIYGAIGLIAAFCLGLGIYLWIARRRRLNNSRDNYEFELIDEEEAEGLNSGEKGAAGGRSRRTRGGELYDAFAEGSDDEQFADYHDGSNERLADNEAEHYAVGEDSDDDDESGNEKGETKPLSGGSR